MTNWILPIGPSDLYMYSEVMKGLFVPTRKVLTTSNVLLPFCVIDLGCAAGYLRVISPHQRNAFG
jgi:hypothetical protein